MFLSRVFLIVQYTRARDMQKLSGDSFITDNSSTCSDVKNKRKNINCVRDEKRTEIQGQNKPLSNKFVVQMETEMIEKSSQIFFFFSTFKSERLPLAAVHWRQ
ncbi:hypothetical protein PUN28_019644 [Cardiocondyla obscurior]|uniref:Uncharacterized protein n=1 Tax=Cardiocondyla obscurior TaxID=286306 RepID=A0AAW2EB32_9HYME